MNKQEAIEKVEGTLMYKVTSDLGICVNRQDVIDIVNQINEPEKPVIPKFVADWIEKHKQEQWWLGAALTDKEDDEFRKWMVSCDMDTRINNQNIFARAWLDGYEVEREKLYTVELPNPNGKSPFRKYGKDFDWAWQFAKEAE
ncbi:DUF1642 domain-containing protein [Streptococcus anginosus]|uniref:DUF1642 domain-containing protein n=1 Tax=Streptococcus anginosus TaxID=1328 RepID=UPI0035685BD5